jgi:hypothetical protein
MKTHLTLILNIYTHGAYSHSEISITIKIINFPDKIVFKKDHVMNNQHFSTGAIVSTTFLHN